MSKRQQAKLVLTDGSCFEGQLTGHPVTPVWGEVVFNTSMTGYQEVITDPSYAGQIVVMTYPEIGNYGVKIEDNECATVAARALVVHELSTFFSPAPGRSGLEQFMQDSNMPGMTGVDTRAVALHIRRDGAVMGAIGGAEQTYESLLELARTKAANRESDLVASVTGGKSGHDRGSARVAVVDFGAKKSIIDAVHDCGAATTVFDSHFSARDILEGGFDGVVLSNGPGDPTDVPAAIDNVRQLIGKIPLLGICLGHQVTALALGGSTYKLKFGHRGANQPVVDQRDQRVFITSQNHGYAVADDLADVDGVEVTFANANDGTLEGFACIDMMVECVQFHPEAAPGPQDTSFVFTEFFNRLKGAHHAEA